MFLWSCKSLLSSLCLFSDSRIDFYFIESALYFLYTHLNSLNYLSLDCFSFIIFLCVSAFSSLSIKQLSSLFNISYLSISLFYRFIWTFYFLLRFIDALDIYSELKQTYLRRFLWAVAWRTYNRMVPSEREGKSQECFTDV